MSGIPNAYYDSAFNYLDQEKVDSAFLYFDRAKDMFIDQLDSLNAANCLIQMAITQTDCGDYFGGQETSLQALVLLNEKKASHNSSLASNYNNLGIATYNLVNYDQALAFYDLAIGFSEDSSCTRTYLNNKAVVYKEKKDYGAAISTYLLALNANGQSPKEYARILSNLARTKWLQNPGYDARPELFKALQIRLKERDLWGQNASYSHLADYYAKSQLDSALFYAGKMYAVAQKIKSSGDQIQALEKLIKLSPPDSIKPYFDTYRHLNDSVQLVRSAAKNQFAIIRYEVEKSKAENLMLQRENAEKAYQVNRQRIISWLIVFVTLVFAVGGFYWHKRRKERLELESQNRIKESQLKTSKKIHDVVANGLYRVMSEIEYQEGIDREGILDRLEDMYEKSRDISYEDSDHPLEQPDFGDKIANMLKSFATNDKKVLIVGNEAQLWQAIHVQVKVELEHVLQELMVNMRKHSHASLVVVKFAQQDGRLHVNYSDDGVGLPKTFRYGNGLRNTGNRIESLGGHITFDSVEGKGLKVQISFPLF